MRVDALKVISSIVKYCVKKVEKKMIQTWTHFGNLQKERDNSVPEWRRMGAPRVPYLVLQDAIMLGFQELNNN